MSLEKPKKIVINNTRKSMVLAKSIAPNSNNQNIHVSMTNSLKNDYSLQKELYEKMEKLSEQRDHYKDKHDASLVKVKFLTQQLQKLGTLDKVPAEIKKEVSETVGKIKSLEELYCFKRTKQMNKLKLKIKKFIEMLEFEITEEDLEKLEDELEIIFFMMDLFTVKYNSLMADRAEIDLIVEKLKEDTVFNREQLEDNLHFLSNKNQDMTHYIRELELEVFNLKKERNAPSFTNNNIKSSHEISRTQQLYEDNIRALQFENEHLQNKIKETELILREKEFTVLSLKRRADESQSSLTREKAKYKQLEYELERVEKEEIRWRERYSAMEEQKNQRIKLLEQDKRRLENRNYGAVQKKVGKAWTDEIVEESGEEYFDVENK